MTDEEIIHGPTGQPIPIEVADWIAETFLLLEAELFGMRELLELVAAQRGPRDLEKAQAKVKDFLARQDTLKEPLT